LYAAAAFALYDVWKNQDQYAAGAYRWLQSRGYDGSETIRIPLLATGYTMVHSLTNAVVGAAKPLLGLVRPMEFDPDLPNSFGIY